MTRTQFVVTNLQERKQKDFSGADVSRNLSKFKQRELTLNLVKHKNHLAKMKRRYKITQQIKKEEGMDKLEED